jgi:hypothetical protein
VAPAQTWIVPVRAWERKWRRKTCVLKAFSLQPVFALENIVSSAHTINVRNKNPLNKGCYMFLIKEESEANENQFKDRRMFARFKAEILLRCLTDKRESCCLTLDISAQGLGLVSPARFRPDSQVELYLRLPETKEEFMTEGTIAWCREVEKDKFRLGVYLEKPELMIVSQLLNGCNKSAA